MRALTAYMKDGDRSKGRASCFALFDLKEKDELNVIFQINRGKTFSAARNWINFVPQREVTTFAFASVSILLLWLTATVCIPTSVFLWVWNVSDSSVVVFTYNISMDLYMYNFIRLVIGILRQLHLPKLLYFVWRFSILLAASNKKNIINTV